MLEKILFNKIYVADFETTVINEKGIKRARVWLWVLKEINNNIIYRGYDIETFFNKIFEISTELYINSIYFHNIKFDGQFILKSYLCKKKYGFRPCIKINENKDFLVKWIKNHIFNITLLFENTIIRFLCSFRIFSIPVKDLSKKWIKRNKEYIKSLNISNSLKKDILNYKIKGEINYTKERKEGYIPTAKEIDYADFDILVVENIIKEHIQENKFVYNKHTKASWSVFHWKQGIKGKYLHWVNKNWFKIFKHTSKTQLKELHKYFQGGITTPIYKNLDKNLYYNNKIYGFDIVSAYPAVMYNTKLPYGFPIFIKHKCNHDFYIIKFKVIKRINTKSKINHIYNREKKIKYTNFLYKNEIYYYNKWTFEVLLSDINQKDLQYIKILKKGCFETTNKRIFNNHIDYFLKEKNYWKNKGNKIMTLSSKLMLNSLFGKFGTSPFIKDFNFKPIENYKKNRKLLAQWNYGDWYLDVKDDFSLSKGIYYLPVSIHIAGYQRAKMIKALIDNKENCLYTDTDSIFLTTKNANGLKLGKKLGDWEYKKEFLEGYFLKPKRYVLKTLEGEWKYVIASIKGGNKLFKDIDITKLNEDIVLKNKHTILRHIKDGVVIEKSDKVLKK